MKNKKASKQDAGIPFRAWAQPPMQDVVAECCRMRRPPLHSLDQDEPGAGELKHVDVRRLGKARGVVSRIPPLAEKAMLQVGASCIAQWGLQGPEPAAA
jgi:hypothetical protein